MTVDLTGRVPPWPSAAVRLWRRCLTDALAHPDHSTTPPAAGLPELRAELAILLGTQPDEVLVTAGVRAAAPLVATAIVAGTGVVVERPGFAGIPAVLRASGVRVRSRTWTDMAAHTGPEPVTYWVTAPCRNPDGAQPDEGLVTALQARRERGHRLVVNEIYRWVSTGPAGLACDVRVGSLSKVAGGGLRVGWVRARPDVIDRLAAVNVAVPPAPWQRALAQFLRRSGLRRLHGAYVAAPDAARQAFTAAAGDALAGSTLPAAGPFLLAELPNGLTEPAAVADLGAHGLAVGAGSHFHAVRPSVRLCFTAVPVDAAAEAGRRFAALIAQWSRGASGGPSLSGRWLP